MPYNIAKELVETKIRLLREEVFTILERWNQIDVETFQKSTREGKIPEAETDAIIAGNLTENLRKYEKLLANL